ncbi:MAG: STAS domain-containing protein [Polyangia bacterium]
MADKSNVTVPFERIQRVIDILSMVSIGEYSPELIQISPSEHADEFSVLEAALNIYNQELAAARAQNERYIAELERSKRELQEQLTTIARQQLAIHELSTPIVEVWEDILLLPIIGTMDAQRAQEMTEKLLDRVRQSRSRCIIVDITGVDVVDTNTANSVLKMTRAARLLGAFCVVTGIRPEIARTLIQLGVEMEGLRTLRTLKDGLRECFAYLRTLRERERMSREAERRRGGALGLLPSSRSGRRRRTEGGAPADADDHAPVADEEERVPEPVPLAAALAALTSDGSGGGPSGK